jgi:branched-chain amino acid aminotransferase
MNEMTPISAERFAGGAAYIQGRFVPMAEATIPVTDWGFTRSALA